MWLLTLRDLQYRRVRVLVVVALASVVMALLFLMTGLVNQFNHEPFDATRAVGAEHWVLAEGTSGPFTSAGTLPSALVGELGGDAHGVVVARGTIAEVGADEETAEVVLVGGEPESLSTTMAAGAIVDGGPVERTGRDRPRRVRRLRRRRPAAARSAARRGRRADVGHDRARRAAPGLHRDRHGAGPHVPEPRRDLRRAPRPPARANAGRGGRSHRRRCRRGCSRPPDRRHRLGRPRAGVAVARHRGHHRRGRVPQRPRAPA